METVTAGAEAVQAAIARARAAQPAWAATPVDERMRILARFRDSLVRRRQEIAELVTAETGRPAFGAMVTDVIVALESAKWTERHAPRFLAAGWRRLPGALFLRKRVREEKLPLGVVGIITPWNYPFFMPASCVLPVIACGNAAVLKPSELTPRCGQVVADLLREAGLPAGVLEVVQGDGRVGAALTNGGVDKMFFTGSVATGRKVAQACAEQLIPCSLELGGSDPAIVLADADLRHAADGIAWSRFANTGQTCVAVKRVFVEAPAYEPFLHELARVVQELRVGPPTDASVEIGPLITESAAAQLRAQLEDAVASGATIAAQSPMPTVAGGAFVPPTVLTHVSDAMRVMREETFGPLLPVVKVRDAAEAIARANDSEFGLSASVWTRDRRRGAAIARQLAAGTVVINDASTAVGAPDVAYGGVKHSGIGRAHGRMGLEACVRHTAVMDDWFSAWRQPWWFRYGPRRLAQVDDYVRFAHGRSLGQRLRAIPGVLRLVFGSRDKA